MSLEKSAAADDAFAAELRAVAHPLRLRMLSLLTGAAMTATEVAQELGITHANASYHLRRLLVLHAVVVENEGGPGRGGSKRYRYDVEREASRPAIGGVTIALHRAAQAPRTEGAVRTNTSIAMFLMDPQ